MKFILFVVALTVPMMGIQQQPTHNGLSAAPSCWSMHQLVVYVARETGYRALKFCPHVRITSLPELRSNFATASAYGANAQAAYLPSSDEILISDEIDLASQLGRSFLLHEIVHAAQVKSGVTESAPCIGRLESEAYRVQASFLRQHGLAKDAIVFEWMSVMHNSACTHFDYYS